MLRPISGQLIQFTAELLSPKLARMVCVPFDSRAPYLGSFIPGGLSADFIVPTN